MAVTTGMSKKNYDTGRKSDNKVELMKRSGSALKCSSGLLKETPEIGLSNLKTRAAYSQTL